MPNILYLPKKKIKERLKATKHHPFKFLARKLKNALINLKGSLSNFIDARYYVLYTNRERIKHISLRLICASFIVLLVFLALSYIFIENNINIDLGKPSFYLIIIAIEIVASLVIYLFIRFYYLYFGKERVLRYEYQLTTMYITNKLPKINKVYGKTGAGKDTFSVACSVILANYLRDKLINELEDLKRILYIFDFEIVDNYCLTNYNNYTSYSYKRNKNAFLLALETQKGFIKLKYRDKVKWKRLVELWSLQDSNPNLFIDKLSYTDGIRYFAFYQLLLEYILKYIRVYIEANFIMSNQPLIETEGLPAKHFSLNFMQVKQMEYKEGRDTYESVMLFPWKDNIIVLETEAGSWYFNRDKQNSKEIYQSGVRDFKAYNRHFLENLYWFTNDQDSSRVDKLLRELDHSYIQILKKEVIKGGIKRTTFYNYLLKRLNSKVEREETKKSNRKRKLLIYTERKKIYDIENKPKLVSKYKNKYEKLKAKNINAKKLDQHLAKRKNYLEKIAKASNEGYIKLLVNVSDSPVPINLEETTLSKILSKDKMLYKSSYQVELTFKIKDAHGRYDTHYMKAVAERIASESNYDFIDIPRWNEDLKITKEDVLYMGYPASFGMFGITDEEYKNFRYTKKK